MSVIITKTGCFVKSSLLFVYFSELSTHRVSFCFIPKLLCICRGRQRKQWPPALLQLLYESVFAISLPYLIHKISALPLILALTPSGTYTHAPGERVISSQPSEQMVAAPPVQRTPRISSGMLMLAVPSSVSA